MSRKDSRATSMACSSRQRRAELLLESVRHPSNHIPVQIKSAPEFRHLNSAPDGLLGELLDTDITVIDNIEQSSGLSPQKFSKLQKVTQFSHYNFKSRIGGESPTLNIYFR